MFWVFAARQHVDGYYLSTHCNVYNWLFNTCTLKTCRWTVMSIIHYLCFRFFVFYCLSSLYVSPPSRQPGSLASCRTNAKSTYRPLTTISLKICENNSSKYLPLPAREKSFAEFPFLYIFNSLLEARWRQWNGCLDRITKESDWHLSVLSPPGYPTLQKCNTIWIYIFL